MEREELDPTAGVKHCPWTSSPLWVFSLCFQLHPLPHSKHAWKALTLSLHCAFFLECSVPKYLHCSISSLQGFILTVLSLVRPSLTNQEISQGKVFPCKHEDLSLHPQNPCTNLGLYNGGGREWWRGGRQGQADTWKLAESHLADLTKLQASKRPCLKQKVGGT